ncbi:hypothetical protein C8R43DRAFT_1230511 [Mycena crocata]|nr:hypothetical protein C8R43DRAFT_1230511 [Mycena crocata]
MIPFRSALRVVTLVLVADSLTTTILFLLTPASRISADMREQELCEDNNAAIKYSSGEWARAYGSIYHGSTVMRTRRLGDSMAVKFEGSAINFMGAQGWDHGSFLVNLDGEETKVDGYCCGPNGGVPQVIQFEKQGLTTGTHLLNITNLAAGPAGSVLEVDALLITPHPGNEHSSRFPWGWFFLNVGIVLLIQMILRKMILRRKASTERGILPSAESYPGTPLPLTDRDSPAPAAPTPRRTLPPAKHERATWRYFDERQAPEDQRIGASGSGNGGPSGTGIGEEDLDLPPDYAQATPGSRVDDELVERIAQRVANIVRDEAPPTYQTTTARP